MDGLISLAREIRTYRKTLGVACALGLVFGACAFMYLDTVPPYEFDVSQSYIVPDPAEDGQQITVNWKVKENRICPGVNYRTLIDPKTRAVVATYDPVAALTRMEGEDLSGGYLRRTFLLPAGPLPAEMDYRARTCFSCNPLQRLYPFCVQTPLLRFRIKQPS